MRQTSLSRPDKSRQPEDTVCRIRGFTSRIGPGVDSVVRSLYGTPRSPGRTSSAEGKSAEGGESTPLASTPLTLRRTSGGTLDPEKYPEPETIKADAPEEATEAI